MSNKNDYTVIGIDGGGTHTRGVLYRENKIVATAKAGTTRIGAVGVGESCERTLNVILDLCKQAGIDGDEVDAIVVGLAGVWLNEEKLRAQALLKTLARAQHFTINDLMITSDAEIALEGAFAGESGIIMIVGTGSIALGKAAKGKLVRCGGWGIELDDEGSGAWIGREGLTAVVRSLDGRGKPTLMSKMLPQVSPIINIDNPRTIVKAYNERAFEYHMLTPLVMQCAVEADEVCLEIITRSSKHLMELPMALESHFKSKTVPVAMLGGIIDAKTLLAQMLEKEFELNSRLELVKPKGTALDGAIAIGMAMIEESL